MRHANVAVFVPHAGCPHQCSFCNQRAISGTQLQPDAAFVRRTCSQAVRQLGERCSDAELAFFGGSFTAIECSYMLELLGAAQEFVGEDGLSGIRVSTRPDAISPEILELLKEHRVTAIELGVQSLDNRVLALNKRGHTAQDAERAARLIRSYGFSLGLQMMVGLYGDSKESLYHTARQIVALSPDTVRIYPTVVLRGTALEALYQSGAYQPLELNDAVDLCAGLLELFEQAGIRVIRLGLHAEEELQRNLVGGVYHPAFRELCESRILLNCTYKKLEEIPPGKIILRVNPRAVSKMAGQRRCNLLALRGKGYEAKIVGDPSIGDGLHGIEVIKDVETCC